MEDVLDLKSSAFRHAGSSPVSRTKLQGGAVAARLVHNQEVAGSSPAPATNFYAERLV